MATNGSGVELDEVPYEVASFNDTGEVANILVLEFGVLPTGKTRVVQFGLPGTQCAGVSRLLVNDQRDCAVPGGQSPDICMKSLAATSRLPGIRFGL